MVVIREPTDLELENVLKLRWEINRKPFGLPRGSEVDDAEADSIMFAAFDDGNGDVLGSVRLTIKKDVGELKFMGVAEGCRNKGIGRKLMDIIHTTAKLRRLKKIKLSARKTAEGFYKKLGYAPLKNYWVGEPYNQEEVEMEIDFKY